MSRDSLSVNTFSIVAYDPDDRAWGVALASKFLAAGALVPWARAGVGAVATQAYLRVPFGPEALERLAAGASAREALDALIEADQRPQRRQLAIVDAQGRAAAHTGEQCHDWAGHKTGDGYAVQGNILTGPEVLEAMASAFIRTGGELADRLVAALRAGDSVGGDKRGRQSAAVMVVRAGYGYGGDNDRYLDLRVDDDAAPIKKLEQLLASHHLYFSPAKDEDQLDITADIARELQTILVKQGYLGGEVNGEWDALTQQAFWFMIGNENLEERWNPDKEPGKIDRIALEYLRRRFG